MADTQLIDVANLNWPFSVLSSTNTPPGSPTIGDCYLAGSSPTGAWSGHTNAIARFNDSSAWEFQTPSEGRTVWNVATDLWVTWNGSAWVNANPLPTGGSTGQVLAKTSGSNYAVGWVAAATSTPLTVYFFLNTGTINDATGVIGDLAVVGGSPNSIYYKNTSNVWTLGGPISSSTTYGSVSGLTVGGSNTDGVASSAARSDHLHSLPAFGTTSGTFCQGNDSRLSDSRAPSGTASGDLSGSFPSPTVAAIHETSGPTQLTLGSVSDGQYLKRNGTTVIGAAAPATVTVKKAGTTIGTRSALNLIEGSNVTITTTDNSGSDRVDVTIASSASGGASWSYSGLLHRYAISSSLGVAGTSVTTLTDTGSSVASLLQATSALAPTVGVDGSGFYYIAGNGTTQYMEAATPSDWRFLDGDSPFTVGMVINWHTVKTASDVVLYTTQQGSSTGFFVGLQYLSTLSDNQGPSSNLGGGVKQKVEFLRNGLTPTTVVIRHVGSQGATGNATSATQTPQQTCLFVNGVMVSSSGTTSATNAGFYVAATRALALFARRLSDGTTIGTFSSARLYDLWFHNQALPTRKIELYHDYASTTWGVTP